MGAVGGVTRKGKNEWNLLPDGSRIKAIPGRIS
jgi:hypothetical protein